MNEATLESTAGQTPRRKYLGEVGAVHRGMELDERRLTPYLEGTIKGFRGPVAIQQFDGGQSNPTYLLRTAGDSYVLRRRPPGVLLESAHQVHREFRVMRALFEVGFPVPEPLVMCFDEDVLGSQFYVMRFVPGRIFCDCLMPDLSAPERAVVFDSVNATLARLHALDPVKLGLGDFGRPGSYFARQIARWSRQYAGSRTRDIAEMEKLVEWLPTAVPPDDGRVSVLHGDFSFHNLLIDARTGAVAGVIDWELSTLGHPLGDLSYHLMEWYRPEAVDHLRGTLRGKDLRSLGIPDLDAYVRRYAERTGIDVQGLPPFYRAFNLFRVAAILQGVAARAAAGNAAASNASQVGDLVPPLAVAAWQEAQEAGAG
ncbi:MAG TPA: phosphotransferase family protein [Steroidobacteraceae bacterium]|nr:phosphotransferase family protein [Steroidobacteraceae bacterium]